MESTNIFSDERIKSMIATIHQQVHVFVEKGGWTEKEIECYSDMVATACAMVVDDLSGGAETQEKGGEDEVN